MTIEDLIEILSEYPKDAEVVFTGVYTYWEHDDIEIDYCEDKEITQYFPNKEVIEVNTNIVGA